MRCFRVPHRLSVTLTIGLIAIGLLFPAEIAGGLWVRGQSLQEYVASFVTSPATLAARIKAGRRVSRVAQRNPAPNCHCDNGVLWLRRTPFSSDPQTQ
jgi:hypothetical protein